MSRHLNPGTRGPHNSRHAWWPLLAVVAAAFLSCLLYFEVARLSGRFLFGRGYLERPIVAVLVCFAAAFALYLWALWAALRAADDLRLRITIVLSAVAMRLILLPTTPIQEIDIYRYVWDGAVVRTGISPFRYSPSQVVRARSGDDLPAQLAKLVALRDRSPALATIVSRIHYAELPTIYPPTSQAIFALASMATPRAAGVATHLTVMKAFFVVFDLATLAVVFGLLRLAGRHTGWAIAYGWCPLVLKEIANGGHLDSLAVFLTTLSVYIAATVWFPKTQSAPDEATEPVGRSRVRLTAAALLLGLAVGAKLYPLVLVPLLAITGLKHLGWKPLVVPAAACAATVALLLWPMLPHPAPSDTASASTVAPPPPPPPQAAASPPVAPQSVASPSQATTPHTADSSTTAPNTAAPSMASSNTTTSQTVATQTASPQAVPGPQNTASQHRASNAQDPSRGLQTFLRRFEMNDLLFLLVVENLKPQTQVPPDDRPWFSIVPDAWRRWLLDHLPGQTGRSYFARALLATRLLMACLFVCLALWFAVQAARAADAATWFRWVFLTLAWFWMLAPTQNPWYWLWALPLVPLARCRAWLLVSGVALVYYLRFWFIYHFPQSGVAGTSYNGMLFFDFVVVWFEFLPVLMMLAVEWLWRPMRSAGGPAV